MADKVKVSMNLLEEDLAVLKRLAEKRGRTLTDVVRQAIALEDVISQAKDNGDKVLIEDRNKKIRELIIR